MVERVGVIVVHGIGEQKPGDHVETVVRPLASAMRNLRWNVTIEDRTGAVLRREGEPHVVLHVARQDGAMLEIGIHEVHWADINEENSIGKGIRFWLWGLGAWCMPRYKWRVRDLKPGEPPHPQSVLASPVFDDHRRGPLRLRDRLQLFVASWTFASLAIVVQGIEWMAQRLFNTRPWPAVKLIVSYLSAVKIYTQPRRHGPKFLGSHLEPPRFTIRRRMVEAIVDVALCDYDRWYVLAHSQGTVVAHYGLMATGAAIANFLSDSRFARLRAAPSKMRYLRNDAPGAMPGTLRVSRPAAPVGRRDRRSVDRNILFQKFRGLLTYGSPLDKYAAIWPGTVSIHTEPGFHPEACWFNVYDTVDPVSGPLDAYTRRGPEPASMAEYAFKPINRSMNTHWALLLGHLRYLKSGQVPTELATAVAWWLTDGATASMEAVGASRPSLWRRAWKVVSVILLLALQATLLVLVIELVIWLVPDSVWAWLPEAPVPEVVRHWGQVAPEATQLLGWTILVIIGGIVGALFTEQDPEDEWVGHKQDRYLDPPILLRVIKDRVIDQIRNWRGMKVMPTNPQLSWLRRLAHFLRR
ncbi:MAG TPA: hypothetical protein VHL31_00430 [Geminicoccus sp.]|jgi:hypothetical protein|uniref:hypothetical protein n=1 Tax=Geminicoccus sp. TaxID=2024832 RepID=UPI002E33377E|nr:hypothetical protein [Geminicoccus sp.]HEX2524758.1 hypothetical protein [Geminicoccus sp.]